MTVRKALTYCELDLKRCSRTYGTAPCTAAVGVTGDFKCYNSPNTCQDAINYGATTLTLRFAYSTDYLPAEISAIPSIKSVSTKAQVLDPGVSLGERESVTVVFEDHPHNDVGIDRYRSTRGFDPFQRGTFWSKFKARWPYIQGSALRIIRGFEGDDYEDMETRHYIIESTSGPDSNGNFSITAKDAIKLFDGDKAQAPAASNGVLLNAIDDNDNTLTLSPAGIGNLEYPTSGIASIGDEQVTFTRAGNTVTLSARGVDSSTASSHEAGETFQLGINYDGEDPADIIYDLATGYTDLDASMITLADWQAETGAYIARQYSAKILKPTSVKTLIDELISEVGLVIYSDTVNQKVVLRALRQFTPLLELDDNIIIEDTFDIEEQPQKRVSLILTYIGRKNPLKELDEESNYRIIVGEVPDNDVAALEERLPSIKKVKSRWIGVTNRPAAESLNDIILARYTNPPRKFKFQLPIIVDPAPVLGSAITVSHRKLQDAQGSEISTTAQIISLEKTEARYTVVAEEMSFVQEPVTDHIITIDSDTFDFNLREVHDQIYADAESGDNVIVRIDAGVKVGASKTSKVAFNVGDWAAGVNIYIYNNGRIQGCGGRGGRFDDVDKDGRPGGTALYTRFAITLDNSNGEIFGGAGGGAGFYVSAGSGFGGNGGGGAGYLPGATPAGQVQATPDSGGGGSTSAGNGGDPGEDGQASAFGNTGGLKGKAIDGDSYITFDSATSPADEGDIRGTRSG